MVRRVYIAQTQGFVDRDIDIEMIRDRWNEVMDGADPSLIPCGGVDTTQWDFKPYKAS